MDATDRIGRALSRIYMALAIALLATLLIHSLPEHQIQAVRLRLLRWSARVTSRLARHTADASMGRELSTGEQLYSLPYQLALLADRLGRAYDRDVMT